MPSIQSIEKRFPCPCCGCPTIHELGAYDICEICNWEDDGQNDIDADEIRGGPNSEYSLTEARSNFLAYGVMYRPGNDQRITGPDNDRQSVLKASLIEEFSHWQSASSSQRGSIERTILKVENELFEELMNRVNQHEQS